MARSPADPAPAPADARGPGDRRWGEEAPAATGDELPGGRFGVARLPGRFGFLAAMAGAMAALFLAVALVPFAAVVPAGPARTVASLLLQDVAFVAAVGVVAVLAGPLRRSDVGLIAPPRQALATALTVGAFVGYLLLAALVLSLLGASDVVDTNPQRLGITNGVTPALAVGSVAATATPIAEELVFRLLLFCGLARLLARLVPSGVAIVVAAVFTGALFGLAHGGATTTVLLVPLAIFGAILCLVTWATRSLLPAIAIHAVNNAISVSSSASFSLAGTAAMVLGTLVVLGVVLAVVVQVGRAVGPVGRSIGGPELARI